MSGNSDPSGALALGTVFGAVLFFKGFRTFREYKVVADTPRMPIRSIAMGLVHIRGRAQSDALIPSPITHTPCCFYQVKIERWKSDSHGGNWENYRTSCNGEKFYLQDETGKVLVDSYSAEYDLPESPPRVVDHDKLSAAHGAGASDEELLQFVQQAGVGQFADKIGHWLQKKGPFEDPQRERGRQALMQMMASVNEYSHSGAVQAGAPAAALQKLIEAGAPLGDAEKERERQAMLEHLREFQAHPLSIPLRAAGGMASGRYRLREFLILPGEEYNITGTCAENPNPRDRQDQSMIAKGESEKTFLISSKSDTESRAGLRKHAAGMVFGGAALALACLGLLLAHLGLF